MDKGSISLQGKDINQAVAKLGYPDSQETIMGQTVYVWDTRQSGAVPIMTCGTSSGAVGAVPYYGNTSNTNYVPVNYNCTVRIVINQKNKITHAIFAAMLVVVCITPMN